MTVALVTGASAGIGREFTEQLAAAGHDLVIVARDEARLQGVRAELESRHGVSVEVLAADLTERADLERVAQRCRAQERPVEVLVNNAGFGTRTAFLDTDLAEEEAALDVMCRAVLVLTHAAARGMRERGHGTVINVSSVAGWIATGTYSAAKAWVTTFSESIAGQLAGTGVTVTAVCPGFTRTEFHERAHLDMSRLPAAAWLSAPDLVAGALADADRGRVVSVPGALYRVLAPLARHAPRRLVRGDAMAGFHRKRT